VIDKEEGENTSIVVMVNNQSMSIHVIELNSAEEQLAKLADAFTRD
jgi:hypothetical protein